MDDKTMARLTERQAVVISGYTGIMCCKFSELHAEVEKRIGHPVRPHEFLAMKEAIKELFRDDFMALIPAAHAMQKGASDGSV